MKIVCEECGSAYKINDDSIKGKVSIKTQCPKCKFVQKNSLIKAKESNPFEDNNKTVDFVKSFNDPKDSLSDKENNIEEDLPKEKYKPISLPSIDLESLKNDEISEEVNKFKDTQKIDSKVIKQEKHKKPKKNKEEEKELYNAKKGSSFLGPFTIDEIKVKIEKRKITKEFLFSKNGGDWASIEGFQELIPFFNKIKPKSNALKYLIIGVFLILIAIVTVTLLETYHNKDDELFANNSKNTSTKKANLLDKHIEKWKKSIILSNTNEALTYSQAIQNFYYDSSDLYIKSSNQFKEVLIKNNLKYDAFYYLVLTVSLSEINIESKETLKSYLKILKSIKNSKKHNELYYNALSALSFKLDKFVDAFNYAEETKNIVASNSIANYLLAKFYFNSKKTEKTIKHLKVSIKADNRLKIAKNLLAKTFIDFELYKQGISFYEKRDTNFSKLILSKIYILLGYYDKSYKILNKLHKNPKRLIQSDIIYSELLYQYKNKRKLALKILRKVEKKSLFKLSNKEKISTLNHISTIYRLNNKKSKSIAYSKKILSISPNNKLAILNLALIRIKQRKFKEVKSLLSRIEKNKDLGLNYNLVKLELFLAKKDYKNAVKEIKSIISSHKYNNIYHIYLANIMAQQKNLNLVQETLLNLTAINPSYYHNNNYKLTNTFIKKFNFKYLISFLRKYLKSDKADTALVLNNLGILEYQVRNFKKAAFYFTKSIELSDRNISNYLYLAYTNFNMKNYVRVTEIANIGYNFGKNEYLFLIHIKALLKMKKIDEARKLLKKVKYDFENTNNTKLIKSLVLIAEGKEELAKELLLDIRDSFSNDFEFKKLLFSLTQ